MSRRPGSNLTSAEQRRALATAVQAARTVGGLMRRHLGVAKVVQSSTSHDIKLELDVRCQQVIEPRLLQSFPDSSVLGEEGSAGDPAAARRWVVDPIDGTVNFTYGVPHACVSIALQLRRPLASTHAAGRTGRRQARPSRQPGPTDEDFQTVVGVVYDPFCDELWTARRGHPARLNGRPIRVSPRRRLADAMVSIGFGKTGPVLDHMLPALQALAHRVLKLRTMGAAALDLTYVASGRFDACVEAGLRLWDIAAGGLILECAGGQFWRRPLAGEFTYEVLAHNGHLLRQLRRHVRPMAPA